MQGGFFPWMLASILAGAASAVAEPAPFIRMTTDTGGVARLEGNPRVHAANGQGAGGGEEEVRERCGKEVNWRLQCVWRIR